MKRGLMVGAMFLSILLVERKDVSAEEAKGLASGLLSLDSSVGVLDNSIQNGKSSLENALGIKISGFFDTSYTWSSNKPGGPDLDISGRYFDQDHGDVVFNAFNLTLEKPEKDWGVGFKLVGDFGRSGELLREATFYGVNKFKGAGNGGEPSAELREGFLTTTIPLGEGLGVKGGLFVTTLGTEILPNPGVYNDNISRSFLFNFAIPFRHLGALFSYPLFKILTVTAGPVTGWDDPHDNNGRLSFLGGINLNPGGIFSLASNVITGPEQFHQNSRTRVAWSTVATIKPIDPLTLYLEYTYGHEEKITASLRNATWQGWGAIASYNWTDRFNTALRGEIFKDGEGVRTIGSGLFGATTPKDVTLGEVTFTGGYKFTSQLLGRFEMRHDWADRKVFAEGSSGADKNQTTLAVQAIYTY